MKKRFILVLLLSIFLFQVFSRESQALPDNVHTTTISGDKGDYEIGVCKNTGTVYKLINKRSTFHSNTVQEDNGAACQIAIHSGVPYSLMSDSCGVQGYWNPTQAGAGCSCCPNNRSHKTPKAGRDVDVYCDGILNNDCSSADNNIYHTSHRMMNFDYGSDYQGPYNSGDLMYLEQETILYDTYAQLDLTVVNKGVERNTAFEIPTYYFIEDYEHYYFISDSGIVEGTVPPETPQGTEPSVAGNFITVEHSGETNSAITIAWFYSDEFASDMSRQYGHITRAPYQGKNWVKFNNVAVIPLRQNQEYRLRYLLIPYKYDEEIETEYGRMSVLEFINRKDHFPSRISMTLSDSQYGQAGEYLSPGYSLGNFLVDTNNRLRLGLKSGQVYSQNQAIGFLYSASRFLPQGKKIRKIEFDYETNFDDQYFFAAVDIPGNQFYWKEDRYGVNRSKVSLSFPPVDWVSFGLYTKRSYNYPRSDWEWHFLVENVKLYYDYLLGDLNDDGQISPQDLKILLQNWGSSPSVSGADLNSDGMVNGMDFGIMVKLIL